MIRLTIIFGSLLVLTGIIWFVLTGAHAPTSLIPAATGVLLLICAVIGNASPAARKHAMHGALTVALLGCLGTAIGPLHLVEHYFGRSLARIRADQEMSVMFALCGLFIVVGIRSFIAARRGRAPVP